MIMLLVVNRLGRKIIMSASILLQGLLQIMIVISLVLEIKILFPIGVIGYLFFFFIGLSGIVFVYQVDVLPSELVPVVTIIQYLGGIFFGSLTLILFNLFGLFVLFLILASMTFLCWLLLEGFCIETRNKTKNQIRDELNRKRFLVFS